MASLDKYKANEIGGLFKHNNRSPDDIGVYHSNEQINIERTVFNYFLKKGSVEDINQRLGEVFSFDRKDKVVMGEVCVTLPRDVSPEDEKFFFQKVYEFYCQDFGEKNIVNAVVHKDETQPHIHLDFIPVVTGDPHFKYQAKKRLDAWKKEHGIETDEIERLCCDEIFTREYYDNMHPRLSSYINEQLGYECSIMNGATEQGNKSIAELKAKSLQEQVEALERKKEIMQQEIGVLLTIADNQKINVNDIGLLPLMEKIVYLENANAVLTDIITRNGFDVKTDDLNRIKSKEYFPALSTNINVFDGRLSDDSLNPDEKSIIIIEMYDRRERLLPQQDFIDKDADLKARVNITLRTSNLNSGSQITVYKSRANKKTFIFFKADNERQTVIGLLDLQERLRKEWEDENWRNYHIYMERLEYDTYDFARSVLANTEYQVTYLTGDKKRLDEKNQKEQDLIKTN